MSIEQQIDNTLSSRKAVKEELAMWVSLQANAGFKLLVELQQQNVDTLRNKYELDEVTGVDDLVAAEHNRSMIAATRFNIEFVPNRIKSLREALDLFDDQLRKEREYEQEGKYDE